MGLCNSSTKKDIVHDRQRSQPIAPAEHRPQAARNQRTDPAYVQKQTTAAVSISQDPHNRFRDESEADFEQYGQSYTNRRTREYDILQNIVLSTQVNFIDVDQRPSSLDDEEQQHRMQQYAQKLTAVDYMMVDGSSSSAAVAAAAAASRGGPGAGPQQQAGTGIGLADGGQPKPHHHQQQQPTVGKPIDVASLLGASLRDVAQLTRPPAWAGADPAQTPEEQVRTAFALLRPTETLPSKDAAALQQLSKQLRSALASSFPQLGLKIIVSFEELESEIAEPPEDGASMDAVGLDSAGASVSSSTPL